MRFFPVLFINALGAPLVACIELTGLAIPAVMLFGVASRHLPKTSDQRAVRWLTAVAALYFVKAGWWMVLPGGGVPDLGQTKMTRDGICRQTTGYTCVAASMVTMLRAHGIDASETEMARLAYTQVGGGATDSRTIWALERKLAGTPFRPVYHRLDARGIVHARKPCMVQLDWGFFVSHMVPVLDASDDTVVIGDPLNGRREITMKDFMKEWKRQAITLEER
ncbi:MAG: cysteine peptidase family C39 domain-containing protein [Phycisphaerales bacterium]